LIDVSELMDDPDFARSFTLRRPAGAFSVDGVFASSYSDRQLVGIVQPATPREIQMLPEGSRLKDIISVWSASEMRGADGKAAESDILVVDGKSYRVVRAEPWAHAGYFRVFAEGFVP
jgi:hypothetical protein